MRVTCIGNVEEMTEMPAKTNRDISWATQTCMLGYDLVGKTQTHRGGFKEWPIVQWPMRPLKYGPRRPLMKINKKLPKQDFYSFKLCTVDKVHAVRTFDPPPPSDAHGFLK